MNMVFRGIFVAVMLMLATSSRASLVVFAFTNSSTGMLDTNVYRLTPRSNVQNADGTWNTKGPTVQYQNPTGYATNWLVPNNYLVTNPATGFWESIRVNDSSSNLVWAGNISLGQNANPFVNLVYNPSIAPGANITFATNGNVITIASAAAVLAAALTNNYPLAVNLATNSTLTTSNLNVLGDSTNLYNLWVGQQDITSGFGAATVITTNGNLMIDYWQNGNPLVIDQSSYDNIVVNSSDNVSGSMLTNNSFDNFIEDSDNVFLSGCVDVNLNLATGGSFTNCTGCQIWGLAPGGSLSACSYVLYNGNNSTVVHVQNQTSVIYSGGFIATGLGTSNGFWGNGAGLTNLNAAYMSGVVTNSQANVYLESPLTISNQNNYVSVAFQSTGSSSFQFTNTLRATKHQFSFLDFNNNYLGIVATNGTFFGEVAAGYLYSDNGSFTTDGSGDLTANSYTGSGSGLTSIPSNSIVSINPSQIYPAISGGGFTPSANQTNVLNYGVTNNYASTLAVTNNNTVNAMFQGFLNSDLELVIQNTSPGANASASFYAVADNGSSGVNGSNNVQMGINNSKYHQGTTYFGSTNDGYLFVTSNTNGFTQLQGGGNLWLGTYGTNTSVTISTGNAGSTTNVNISTNGMALVTGQYYGNGGGLTNIPATSVAGTFTNTLATIGALPTVNGVPVLTNAPSGTFTGIVPTNGFNAVFLSMTNIGGLVEQYPGTPAWFMSQRPVVTGSSVAAFRPLNSGTMALDVMGNGSNDLGYGQSWIDVCAVDCISNNNSGLFTLHLSSHTNLAEVTTASYNGGTAPPLMLAYGAGANDTPFSCYYPGGPLFFDTNQSAIEPWCITIQNNANTSGQIGINTTNPAASLEIRPGVNAGSQYEAVTMSGQASGNNGVWIRVGNTNASASSQTYQGAGFQIIAWTDITNGINQQIRATGTGAMYRRAFGSSPEYVVEQVTPTAMIISNSVQVQIGSVAAPSVIATNTLTANTNTAGWFVASTSAGTTITNGASNGKARVKVQFTSVMAATGFNVVQFQSPGIDTNFVTFPSGISGTVTNTWYYEIMPGFTNTVVDSCTGSGCSDTVISQKIIQ